MYVVHLKSVPPLHTWEWRCCTRGHSVKISWVFLGNQFVVQPVFFYNTHFFFLICQSFNNVQEKKPQLDPSSYLFRLPHTKMTGRERVERQMLQPSYPHSSSVAVFVCVHVHIYDTFINALFNCFVSSSEPSQDENINWRKHISGSSCVDTLTVKWCTRSTSEVRLSKSHRPWKPQRDLFWERPFAKNPTIIHCVVHRRQWESNKAKDSLTTSSNRWGPQQAPKPRSCKSKRFLGEPPLAKFGPYFLVRSSACHAADKQEPQILRKHFVWGSQIPVFQEMFCWIPTLRSAGVMAGSLRPALHLVLRESSAKRCTLF